MNLQQIINEQNAKHQSIEEIYCNPIYIKTNYSTAESVFVTHEKHHNFKAFSAILALMSLADYEGGLVEEQYKAWFDVGCFKEISPTFIEDIDNLDKFEQAKLMQMICQYIFDAVSNEQTTKA